MKRPDSTESNPDQARSQFSVLWCGSREVVSHAVQGSSPSPIAPKISVIHLGAMGSLSRKPFPTLWQMGNTTRIGVVGGTGAVGTVTLALLREHGFKNVRVFASARSAGKQVAGWTVEEATPEALARGDINVFLFSVGTGASRELVPHAVAGGAIAVDKSSAYRLEPGIPLVVPEVNGARAFEHTGIIANPNCCTIPLTCVLKPLQDEAGLVRVRVATYQSVSGAGAQSMERLRNESPDEHDLRMDWDFDGEEFDEESKLRAETRKIMELPELPIQATCVRVPVMVGHAEAVWIETENELTPERARELLANAPSVRIEDFPSPGKAAGIDDVLVGRIRRDPTVDRGLALFIASDNLRKGAALNAIQIAELLIGVGKSGTLSVANADGRTGQARAS
jgi:aspartate-semialdehyde dehydrogenase